MGVAVIDFDGFIDVVDSRRRRQRRPSFIYRTENLRPFLVEDEQCIDILAFKDWRRELGKSGVLLERQTITDEFFYGVLEIAALRRQLLDVRRFVRALAVAEPDVEQQEQRGCRHDEHHGAFEQPPQELVSLHSVARTFRRHVTCDTDQDQRKRPQTLTLGYDVRFEV